MSFNYCHSLYCDLSSDYLPPPPLSLLGSVCLSYCTGKAYISVTVGWTLMKLGKSVGTSVRLSVLRFHKKCFSDDDIMK